MSTPFEYFDASANMLYTSAVMQVGLPARFVSFAA